MRTILFIAEPQSVTGVFPTLKEAGLQAGLADNLLGAVSFIKKSAPELIFTRPQMQGYDAIELLDKLIELGCTTPVIVFSANASAEEARAFLEKGARDYWLEPLVWDKIKLLLPEEAPSQLEDAIEEEPQPSSLKQASKQSAKPAKSKSSTASTTKSPAGKFQIIGKHPAVQRVLALARQVARSKATVLISGESGTGKEMFARFLHHNSDRGESPFIAINCAALPEHLLESELFGHEKGAFTGAINRKAGKFELADGGTILLDEITEMDLGLQAKLLRVLQEGEFDRVGGVETVSIDVRVLATTNRAIEQTVKDGKFREDLYYRLNVIPLKLPALAERGEDALLLADFFMQKYCAAYSIRSGGFGAEAKKWLLEYHWPGNVRELQNLMERAVLLAGTSVIEPRHFLVDGEEWMPDDFNELGECSSEEAPTPPTSLDEALSVMPLHEMEKKLILKSLDETSGNRTQAALLLGISVRTLRNKLNEYKKQGIEV